MRHDVFEEDFDDSLPEGKAVPCKESQDRIAAMDSSGLCLFVTSAWGIKEFAAQIDAACEGEWTDDKLLAAGERIWNLERLFNLNAGFTAADDTLPARLLSEPAPSGLRKGALAELHQMLPEYYSVRGWDQDGQPTPETLTRLRLS